MWKLFSRKKDVSEQKPNLDLLNQNCTECQSCKTIASIPNFDPLTIVMCPNCGDGIFIPYLVKNYWLYRPLGGGGMGSVYKAMHHKISNCDFAVKILPRDDKNNQYLIESLIREANIGKTFGRHPHLTYVASYGRYGDEYYSAMEFCPGKRLDQLIDEPESIPHKMVLLWGLQMLSAEQRIYDCGYLYRDLKPQNIIIDKDGNAKLFDYGLCEKVNNTPDNENENIQGSPLYMPPERIVGLPENMNSEIYSLGMVMFHALTKKTYYTAEGVYELAQKHIAGVRFANVSSRMPSNINPLICALLDKMISRNPSERIQTYKEVALIIRDTYNKL